ncbi:uncharacterized protein LOC144783067 [Lissotriton helveticus]
MTNAFQDHDRKLGQVVAFMEGMHGDLAGLHRTVQSLASSVSSAIVQSNEQGATSVSPSTPLDVSGGSDYSEQDSNTGYCTRSSVRQHVRARRAQTPSPRSAKSVHVDDVRCTGVHTQDPQVLLGDMPSGATQAFNTKGTPKARDTHMSMDCSLDKASQKTKAPTESRETPKSRPTAEVRDTPKDSEKTKAPTESRETPKSRPTAVDRNTPKDSEKTKAPTKSRETPKSRPTSVDRNTPKDSEKTKAPTKSRETPKSRPTSVDRNTPKDSEKTKAPTKSRETPKSRPTSVDRNTPKDSEKTKAPTKSRETPKSRPTSVDRNTPKDSEKTKAPTKSRETPKSRPTAEVRDTPKDSEKTKAPTESRETPKSRPTAEWIGTLPRTVRRLRHLLRAGRLPRAGPQQWIGTLPRAGTHTGSRCLLEAGAPQTTSLLAGTGRRAGHRLHPETTLHLRIRHILRTRHLAWTMAQSRTGILHPWLH